MAAIPETKAPRVTRKDFVTCPLCDQLFTDPRTLPCLHTFCYTCICSHDNTAKTQGPSLQCPTCQEPLPQDVSLLLPNSFICGQVELNKLKQGSAVFCTVCRQRKKKSAAKSMCMDCGDFLCVSCSDRHNFSSGTVNHEKILLNNVKNGQYDKKLQDLQKVKCNKHKEDVVCYCQTCCQPVCFAALLTEHRRHDHKTISEASSRTKVIMAELIEKMRAQQISLQIEKGSALAEIDLVQRLNEKRRQEIEETSRTETEDAIKICEERVAEIENKYSDRLVSSRSQLEDARKHIGDVDACLSFCDEILHNGKDEEVLQLEMTITERVKQLQIYRPIDGNTQDMKNENQTAPFSDSDSFPYAGDVPRARGIHQVADVPQAGCVPERRMKLKTTFRITSPEDRTPADVRGLAYAPKVGLILSDNANKKIKIFDTRGTLLKYFGKPGLEPFAVAVVSDRIGFISGNSLHIYDCNGKRLQGLVLLEEVPKQQHQFTVSLAASKKFGFAVSNIKHIQDIRCYTVDGKRGPILDARLNLPAVHMSATPTGDIVLSEWGSGGIRVLSMKGTLRTKTKVFGGKPVGSAIGPNGDVFVACPYEGAVVVISPSGHELQRYQTAHDGLPEPMFLVFDDNGDLYVANRKGNVAVYESQSLTDY